VAWLAASHNNTDFHQSVFLNVLFNDNINCKIFIASATDE
jgi:hypothetical protein